MTTRVELFPRATYASRVVPDVTTDGGLVYLASHPDLPGCMAHGSSPDEALQNLDEARELYITTLVERGISVPEPGHHVVSAVWRSYPATPGAPIVQGATEASAVRVQQPQTLVMSPLE